MSSTKPSSSSTSKPSSSSTSKPSSTTTKPSSSSSSKSTKDGGEGKSNSNNQIFGWALVVIIWVLVGIFLFMYIDMKSNLHTCSTTEGQTCYMFTAPTGFETATCGVYPYRCDDVEVGKVRCGSDPSKIVSVHPSDGDLCGGANFNRCKTTIGSI